MIYRITRVRSGCRLGLLAPKGHGRGGGDGGGVAHCTFPHATSPHARLQKYDRRAARKPAESTHAFLLASPHQYPSLYCSRIIYTYSRSTRRLQWGRIRKPSTSFPSVSLCPVPNRPPPALSSDLLASSGSPPACTHLPSTHIRTSQPLLPANEHRPLAVHEPYRPSLAVQEIEIRLPGRPDAG